MPKFFRKLLRLTPIPPPPCPNGCHDWQHIGVTRHFWNLNPDGTSTGMYSTIDNLLSMYSELYTVREQYDKLMSWKNQGFNAFHTSWNHYECKTCGKTGREEFYTHPHHYYPTVRDREVMEQVIKMVT